MKKALCVVVLLVGFASVFAADVEWEIGAPPLLVPWRSPPESGQAPKDRMSQSPQEQTKSREHNQDSQDIFSPLNPQPNPKGRYASDQQAQGGVDPKDKPPGSSVTFWSVLYIVGGVCVPIGALIAWLNYRQTRRRDLPSLSAENWRLKLDPTTNPAGVICMLRNGGPVEVTVTEGSLNFVRGEGIPPCPNFWSLSPTRGGPFTVPVNVPRDYVFPFSIERWKTEQPAKYSRERLYFYGYIAFTDVRRYWRRRLMFFLTEDCEGDLLPIDADGYNYTATEEKSKK